MIVVGIDEVGRGCWAGPLVASAVILKKAPPNIKDSKLLTKSQRKEWITKIEREALAIGLGWVSAAELDEVGLTQAVSLAMQRALDQISETYDEIIIDGNYNYLAYNPKVRPVIKADMTEPAVSAASIIAKVARDHYMAEACAKYPHYGFEQNVGYGTALHRKMLQSHGVSDIHRRSFGPVRSLLQLSA